MRVSNDLERIITQLEDVTAQMLAQSGWESSSKLGELSASRHALAAELMGKEGMDQAAADRIRAIIEAGSGLMARTMAMRESFSTAIAETERQQRFTHELSETIRRHACVNHVDM